jgi:hypothetical protein
VTVSHRNQGRESNAREGRRREGREREQLQLLYHVPGPGRQSGVQ